MENVKSEAPEFKEKLVNLSKVTKVVKGGRNMRWSALVVVGDENGHVGAGIGKAAEVSEAIRKGAEDAKKHIVNVAIVNDTIPHEIIGEYGAGRIIMKPASEGSGVIAGGPARAVIELTGIKNIRTKSLGSKTPTNVVNATIEGLKNLKTAEQVAKVRGKSVEEILG